MLLNGRLLRSYFEVQDWDHRVQYGGDDFAQQNLQPLKDEADVIADRTHDGVDLVIIATLQLFSAHMAVIIAMPNHRLDGVAAPELLFDVALRPALLPQAEDPHGSWRLAPQLNRLRTLFHLR